MEPPRVTSGGLYVFGRGKMVYNEFKKEMKRLGIWNPFDATEFDTSLNDAIRRDINNILRDYGDGVFGLKLWDFRFLRAGELKDAGNFSVDLIFLEKDRPKVEELVEAYKAGKINNEVFAKNICDLAIYVCWWV